ncbi:MAG TPA: ATP-binding protein [Acidimicrobiales bacterium]|nr:ATP-binding protein [Acidimicrobiales bacterium]
MTASLAIDALPVATLLVDADRVVTAANPAAATLTGRPLDELVGTPCGDLLAPDTSAEVPVWTSGWHPSAHLTSVRGIPEHDVTLRRPDGTTVAAAVAGRYERSSDGALTGAVLVLRARSRRGRRAPSGIEIISTVSHELRSPLTSVKGYTSLLLNRWDRLGDEQKLMMLGQVNHDADRVTRLVTELLDISRLETGRLTLRRQMVDLAALTTSVVEKVGLEYEDLACAVEIDAAVPLVYADPDKVEQVLTNLVENAAKYASPTEIRIMVAVEEADVVVAVHDRGEGIPEADLPNVFTKFFRRDHGRPTGSGLGLWISRGLVEAHEGRLTAESAVGEGSVFRFTLPTDAFEKLMEPS